LLGVLAAQAAMVAPHAVFMDHRTRSGVFYIHNPGTEPIEAEIELRYGYPVSDENGRVRVALVENPGAAAPSAAAWIRALPRRVVVPAGQRQAIRLLARPPAGLPDGEYWSRIIVTASEQAPATAVDGAGQIQVGLRMATRTIISLSYRKGAVHTGVQLRGFDAIHLGDSLLVGVKMTRDGNAAYLGRLQLDLIDGDGNAVYRWDHSVAVYFDLYRQIVLPFGDLPPGPYLLHLRLSTDRQDIAASDVLPVDPIERALTMTAGTIDQR
jgi:hypothetical protein